jgi:hypothetical protein
MIKFYKKIKNIVIAIRCIAGSNLFAIYGANALATRLLRRFPPRNDSVFCFLTNPRYIHFNVNTPAAYGQFGSVGDRFMNNTQYPFAFFANQGQARLPYGFGA